MYLLQIKLVEVTANEEGKYVFTLDKATTVSATFVNKVNTVTLNYEKTQGEVKLINVSGEDLVGTTLNANDTFKVVATPNENYVLKGVEVTQGEETLTDVEGVYTVLDNEDGVNVTVTFEVKTATVTYEAVTGISNVKLNNVDISEVTTLDYGTEVTITFNVDEGYELTNVLLDGSILNATEEVYKFTVSKDTYTLSFEVSVVEETFDDISQILSAEKGTAVKVRGKVVADTANGPLVLDENGNYIYVFKPTGEYTLNDLVKVEGTIGNYSNRNQISNATIETFADDTLVINDLETVGVTYEEISTNTAEYGLTEAKVSFDCRYDNENFYIDGGETNYFEGNNLDTATLGLENGKYYNVEGYVSGYYNNSVSLTVSKVAALKTVTVTAFTLNKDFTIKEGDRIALTASSVSPTYYKENPICEVDDNEYVRIEDGNILVARKAGTGLSINIRASLGGVEDNTFTLTEVGVKSPERDTVTTTITNETLGLTTSYKDSESPIETDYLTLNYKQLYKGKHPSIQTRIDSKKGNSAIYNSQKIVEGIDSTKEIAKIELTLAESVSKNLGFDVSFSNEPLTELGTTTERHEFSSGVMTITIIPSTASKYFYMERAGTSGAIYLASIVVYTYVD